MTDQTFHEALQAATEDAHRSAERTEFIVNLMGGTLSQHAYLRYLEALAPIYEQLEMLLRERTERPLLKAFDHRGLDRFSRMQADIALLRESTGQSDRSAQPEATTAYRARLHHSIEDERLLAHHYIRYLGDLSGGQAIARLVSRHYQIPPEALTFYDFHELSDAKAYKVEYREKLNRADLSETQKESFIAEAVTLYSLSADIFNELGRT